MMIHGLYKTINQQIVLEDIHFTLTQNEIVGLIGRNGSGKTSLFRLLAGYYLPDSGDIQINQQSIYQEPTIKEQIFFIDEKENFLNTYSLKKINAFYRLNYQNFDQDLFLQLTHQYDLSLQLNYRQLSKGMQGLFQMILAICSNATYLLLDEPFDGLDVIVRKQVIGLLLEHLSEKNRTALIASHNLSELEGLIDRALLLKDNKINKEYCLENMRETAKKIQLVFKTKKIPVIVKENSKLINFQGRVITVVFEHYTPELADQIKAYDPLVFEELPLSLEDLFEANLNAPQKKILDRSISNG
ncbi:ATP-binding cassette domain-containing protein [Enterococcus alishanensis]|uniref:ABC transporter ATP-binding protein n=1 Tax=Enterococcus alishanensis TaxID=1303817 RepID=A0ABS6T9M9_9ENTE|nr:ABC transporter ATP-binding protein [Enterococcus alishanensis]MBV7389590.1 ABC transporter ATP-binding protein [Enterococcus alishanensis]